MSPFPSPLAFSPLHLGKAPESKRQLLPNSEFVQPQQSAWKIAASSRKPCPEAPQLAEPDPTATLGGLGAHPSSGVTGRCLQRSRGRVCSTVPRDARPGLLPMPGRMHPSASSPRLLIFPAMKGKELLSLHAALCRGLGLNNRQQRNQEGQLQCHSIPLLLLSWAGLFPGQSKR